jgi:zona occludens toxin (predicted ATPase)
VDCGGDYSGGNALNDEEQRERTGVYGGWRQCETLEDIEEHERLVDRWAERNPGMVDQSDDAIAHERLKMQRRTIERHSKPW